MVTIFDSWRPKAGNVGVLGFWGLARPFTAPFKRTLSSICLALGLFGTTGIRKRAAPLQPLFCRTAKCFALAEFIYQSRSRLLTMRTALATEMQRQAYCNVSLGSATCPSCAPAYGQSYASTIQCAQGSTYANYWSFPTLGAKRGRS